MEETEIGDKVEILGEKGEWRVVEINSKNNCTLEQVGGKCYKTAPKSELRLIKSRIQA